MSRLNPVRWVGGLAIEIGAVVAAVMLLPKADLRPGSDAAVNLQPELDIHQPAWWQAAPYAAATSWQPPASSPQPQPAGSFATDSPSASQPAFPVEQTAWQAPGFATSSATTSNPTLPPADVERTLDRASQDLLNGVGGYFLRQADELLAVPTNPQSESPRPSASPPLQPWRRY